MGIRNRVLAACAAGTVATGLMLGACGRAAPPAPVTPIASCVTEDQQRERGLTVTRSDGRQVDALRLGSGTTALVLANEVDNNLCNWAPASEIWAGKGFQVLLFNYSQRGRAADDDVLAAAAAVRQQGATHVFLIGASMGGTAVLAAATEAQPAVDGVVSLSGAQVIGSTDAISAMPKLSVPALFIAGDSDHQFADATRSLYEAAATTDKQLVIRPTANHGYALLDTDTIDLIQTFITDHGGSAA